jgi:hypothetical protein
MNALSYYFYLRKQHSYRPRYAALATLSRYCTSSMDMTFGRTHIRIVDNQYPI